jgi:RNA polymerase sigma-70 factor (ECF subfamily)
MKTEESAQPRTLAQRMKERDQEAAAELYDRYGRLAMTIIMGIVHDRSTAEDLTQEAFLRIWNSAATFDESRTSLAQWVAAVSRHRAIDYVRSVECRMSRRMVEVDYATARPSPGAWQRIITGDLLRRAMAALTPDQQMALNLWYREGMSHAEIAQRTHAPLGTVKTRLRATLHLMRQYLREPPARLLAEE